MLINFFQKCPVFNNGELEAGEAIPIASVVIPTQIVAELSVALTELLNDDKTDTDIVLELEESKEAEE